jgi:hypothetical protein
VTNLEEREEALSPGRPFELDLQSFSTFSFRSGKTSSSNRPKNFLSAFERIVCPALVPLGRKGAGDIVKIQQKEGQVEAKDMAAFIYSVSMTTRLQRLREGRSVYFIIFKLPESCSDDFAIQVLGLLKGALNARLEGKLRASLFLGADFKQPYNVIGVRTQIEGALPEYRPANNSWKVGSPKDDSFDSAIETWNNKLEFPFWKQFISISLFHLKIIPRLLILLPKNNFHYNLDWLDE